MTIAAGQIVDRDDQRPDPDALLAQIREDEQRESRGKLRIYFGSSAGVGKTYAMLVAARKLMAEGVDVLAGVVETHGRSETAALLEGLPSLPPAQIEYRGKRLAEFDLDGALARKPGLILVDELAHSNVAGSRHPKRWQDVEELLAAGIDVYSTLNVQHLESLNDVVGGITGIVVHETLARHLLRPRRRGGAGGHDGRRADRAAGGRQGLPAGAGQAGGGELLPQGQPDGACASWRCAAPPTAWKTTCRPTAATARSRRCGRPKVRCCAASARSKVPSMWCAAPRSWHASWP